MSRQRKEFISRGRIPQLDRLVITCGDNPRAVRADTHAADP